MTSASRSVLVREELHLVDLRTRRPTPRSAQVLAEIADEGFGETRHSALVCSTSGPHPSLDDLGREVRTRRERLVDTAAGAGVGVVAAGAIASPGVTLRAEPEATGAAPGHESRTRAMAGFTVSVETADRDEAQYAARRIAAYVPVFVALAASSPYWADGQDAGYASVRGFEATWSPSHLTAVRADSAAEYDEGVDRLVNTGVVAERSLVEVDVRPSEDGTGVELHACDSCSTVDTLLTVAALFRGLVELILSGHDGPGASEGDHDRDPSPIFLTAAFWRAARSGLEGDLVDPHTGEARPAAEVIGDLREAVAPQLVAAGDAEFVTELLQGLSGAHSSASRQRAGHRRRGRMTDVVDLLMAETSGRIRPRDVIDDHGMRSMLAAYSPLGEAVTEDVHDEAIAEDGQPRPVYVDLLKAVADLGADEINDRQKRIGESLRDQGITLNVYGHEEQQVFPLDVLPRVVQADEWARVTAGLEQRARALELFLQDIYGPAEIVRAGVVTQDALDRAPGYRATGRAVPPGWPHAPVCGADLVSTEAGKWIVLEDNLRMPGGVAMTAALRDQVLSEFPEFDPGQELWDPRDALQLWGETLRAAAPGDPENASIAVVTNSDEVDAFDIRRIADAIGAVVVTPQQLLSESGHLWYARSGVSGAGREPVDVVFVRMDEEQLLSSTGANGQVLRHALLRLMADGAVNLVNAPGNGAADDKAIFALVPQIIDFYLGEKPLIGQVRTYLCADPVQRDKVLDRLDELVVKPIDGYGGSGITVGPECTPRELDQRRDELRVHPDRFVAQEVQKLSTLPTFDGRQLQRRHVDMRAFVTLQRSENGEVRATAAPTALTRVAPAGTMVVNTSNGGGGKDTWIHRG